MAQKGALHRTPLNFYALREATGGIGELEVSIITLFTVLTIILTTTFIMQYLNYKMGLVVC